MGYFSGRPLLLSLFSYRMSHLAIASIDADSMSLVQTRAIQVLEEEKPRGGFSFQVRIDRSGEVLVPMMHAYAWGVKHNIPFLGVYDGQGEGAEKLDCSSDLLQMSSTDLIVRQAKSSYFAADCAAWKFLNMPPILPKLPRHVHIDANVHLGLPDFEKGVGLVRSAEPDATFFSCSNRVFTPSAGGTAGKFNKLGVEDGDTESRMLLRNHTRLTNPELWSQNEALRVAVHMRRGDVLDCNGTHGVCAIRRLPNNAYIDQIKQIRRVQHFAQFIVFTSTPVFSQEAGFREVEWNHQKEDMGVQFRVDGSITEAWNHMAQADILLHGLSEFTQAPMLISPHQIQINLAEDPLTYQQLKDKIAKLQIKKTRHLSEQQAADDTQDPPTLLIESAAHSDASDELSTGADEGERTCELNGTVDFLHIARKNAHGKLTYWDHI